MKPLLISLFFLGLCPVPSHAQSRTKQVKKSFTQGHPLSSIPEQMKRFHWPDRIAKDKGANYKITKESFNLYVPKRAKSSRKAYGLLVWIAPFADGRIPPIWLKKLDQLKLIAIGADNSGNDRVPCSRIGLALDAVHNAKKLFHIDDKRVYVTGFSGGAQMSCYLTLHYPEIFSGGIYFGGSNYFKNIPIPDRKGSFWKGEIPKPSDENLLKSKQKSRHVFIVGEKDEVIGQIKAVKAVAVKDDFVYVRFIEMPKLGHRIPPAKWLERSIKYLDKPPSPKPNK
jgi:predicted esterase